MSKTIFVSGNFNILHPGHLRLLRFASELGDKLIVAVNSDQRGGEGVLVPEALRLEGLKANVWVDEVFILDNPVTETIYQIKPDIVVKGKEHEDLINPELDAVESYGGKLIFSSGEVIFSSLDLINKDLEDSRKLGIKLPINFLLRHNFTADDCHKILKNYSNLKICIVGDLIVDEYITCDPLGMSQEDPTIVVTPIDSQKFVGGAGIVAAHAAGLGSKVEFISVAGKDDASKFSKDFLTQHGVKAKIFIDESRPTTLKQRYRSKGKTLLRVSKLHQGAINQNIQDDIFNAVKKVLDSSDVLIFSDFNYGCLPQNLVSRIIALAKTKKVITAADSQSSSQVGNISRFHDMDFLFPTEHEARISLRNHDDGLVILSNNLAKKSNAKNVILKLGEEGVLLYFRGKDVTEQKTDKLAALNLAPQDVAGAGDSLLITTMMSIAAGGSLWQSSLLGSLSAAMQVSRVGNTPLKLSDLQSFLEDS
tara:strand:- start:330 stop:1766 length:1437 start_codon:yes stop_codon:yes gene_type:complete